MLQNFKDDARQIFSFTINELKNKIFQSSIIFTVTFLESFLIGIWHFQVNHFSSDRNEGGDWCAIYWAYNPYNLNVVVKSKYLSSIAYSQCSIQLTFHVECCENNSIQVSDNILEIKHITMPIELIHTRVITLCLRRTEIIGPNCSNFCIEKF